MLDGLTATLVAVLVVTGTLGLVAASGGAAAAPADGPSEVTVDRPGVAADRAGDAAQQDNGSSVYSDFGEASDVYLREDGSAVLVFEEESNASQLEIGADVSEGLARILVVDDVEEEDFEGQNVEANATAIIEGDMFSAEGHLLADRPEEVESLDLSVSAEQTAETNELDASLEATLVDTSGGSPAAIGDLTTSGQVTTTADTFETSGQFNLQTDLPARDKQRFGVSLTDRQDGYTVDVTQYRTVSNYGADSWETREQARQTLQRQYGSLAESLGGTSTVEITHYKFEERSQRGYRLELEFTVEYTGIKDGVERQLASQLASDPQLDLDRQQASEIAGKVTELEIETFEASYVTDGATTNAQWDVKLANFDQVAMAAIDVGGAADLSETEGIDQETLDDARAMIEAQAAADLRMTAQWDATVEQTTDGKTDVTAEFSVDSENWAAYVSELENRGIDTGGDVTFELEAHTEGDEIRVDTTAEFKQKDLLDQAIEALRTSAQQDEGATEAEEFVTKLEQSELQIARMDVNVDGETVTVEASAKAGNMQAFVPEDAPGSPQKVVSRGDGETATTYVFVDGLVEDPRNATREDLSHLDVVTEDTTVHQAGEWDREFPEMDYEAASNHLGIEYEPPAETSTPGNTSTPGGEDAPVPGFGFAAALLAVASLLVVVRLRRD